MQATLPALFRYKAWANDELLTTVTRLDDPAHAADCAIATRILNHTYVVDRIFAAHLQGLEHGYSAANTARLPPLAELSQAIRDSDRTWLDYVPDLDAPQLAEIIDFSFTDGLPGRMSREEMLMHLIVHGAYHRGQVGLLLTKNSISPPADLFTGYLHRAEAAARRRSG
jgi:uncharacterized damage-inducible protein DinB